MNIIEELEGLISSKLGVIKTIIIIFRLEAKLFGLSIYPLLLNLVMILVVLMTIWLSAMLFLGYSMMLVCDNPLYVLGFVLVFNLMLMFGLFKYMQFNLKNMSFEKTRDYFSNKESESHGHIEKTVNCQDRNEGKNITTL
ncbi:hypothetical protein EP47_10580 [Legionella norrlandica]|uniref:Uncharacterized protein n=1 Tax=Legionella norrlandica TaxID=1498499 RepID=A0A0A2T5E6_9GAMM|nr:hypothetical protein [Legionella norrlandica]KGP62663.1 hypothetical protein EP47_10580 [Legionella norrlandica]